MNRRELCPISEIDWDSVFYRERPGNDEPDPEGELMGIELLVSRYRAAYPDRERQDWIEARIRRWWQGQNE